jgi:iron complex transport system permease protein
MRQQTPAPAAAQKRSLLLGMLALLALASIVFALVAGSVRMGPDELYTGAAALLHGERASMAATLLDLRLSRALSGFATGAMLALAGVMMQALLRNPLADPYVLGVSGGASVGALFAMLFFNVLWIIDLAAFGGAIAVALLLFALAHRDLRGGIDASAPLLLLTGVIVAAGCGALVTLLLALAPEDRLRGMVFWMIGDLSGGENRWLPWLLLAATLSYALRCARDMNVLALHAAGAQALGVPVGALRRGLFFCAALLTAGAVSNAGSIGFVGLIVPHACRFALGPDHRLLLPASALAGGAFLVLADTLARTVLAPQQLPVGVVTALIGVPAFLLQLHRLGRR